MISQRLFVMAVVFLSMLPAARAVDLGFDREDAGNAGAYLDFGASARSLALGKAYTGVADDASAVYWNPAGLTQSDRKDVVASYSSLGQDTSFGTFNYAHPTVGYGTYGLGFVNLRSSNFKQTDENGQRIGTFSDSQTAFLLSNGYAINRMSFGATLKYVRHEIASYQGSGVGVDLGSMYRFGRQAQAGLTIRNLLAPSVKLQSEDDEYAREVRLGGQYTPSPRWLFSTDLSWGERQSIKPHFGIELNMNEMLALRSGLDASEWTVGMGLNFANWSLDYAFGFQGEIQKGQDLDNTHRLGMHVRFGEPVSRLGLNSQQISAVVAPVPASVDREPFEIEPASVAVIPMADRNLVFRRIGGGLEDDLQSNGVVYFPETKNESIHSR